MSIGIYGSERVKSLAPLFEAALTTHEEAIDAVRETGEELIASGHFAAEEVNRPLRKIP